MRALTFQQMKPTRGIHHTVRENDSGAVARIDIDRNLCIGAGNCCGIAPDLFYLDGEGKAILANNDFGDGSRVLEAAWSCPTDAISVYSKNGNRIYPPPERRSYLNI